MATLALRRVTPSYLKGASLIRNFCPTPVRLLSDEAMKKFEFLKVEEVKPFVYNVELNRPEKMNALNKRMWLEVGDAFRELGSDPDCRVVIMTGKGKVFCSGIDLGDLANLASMVQSDEDVARRATKVFPAIKQYQNAFLEIEKCPKPVIMAIHSACVGGGTNMVCFGDIRYCTKDAWFQVKETALGFAADVGVLQYFPKLVNNQSLMRELCFTARKIPSDEAEKFGIVSRIFEDKESMMVAVTSLAETIAAMGPVGVQNTKLNLNYARDNKIEDALDFAARINMVMLQSEDVMKAAMAMMTKSKDPPTFAKL